MPNTIISILLSLQMLISGTACLPAYPATLAQDEHTEQEVRLWWGLIDPELSTWFAHIPMEEAAEEETILWDWSWRGFLAAIFGSPLAKEGRTDAPAV